MQIAPPGGNTETGPVTINALAGIQKILGVSLGVKDIENDKPNNNNVWFTMQGVRIEGQPVVPGIYIRNGKAVVRK